MKATRLLIGFFVLLYGLNAAAQKSNESVSTFLPDSHIVGLFTADARIHRMGAVRPFGDIGFITSIGGIFPVWSLQKQHQTLQFSIGSSVNSTLNRWTNRGRLVNIDYFLDLYLDYRFNSKWALRTGAGHTSQHLSDDAIIDLGRNPINYLRDYLQCFGVYHSSNRKLYAYGGLVYNVVFKTTVNLSPRTILQFGFEHIPVTWKKKHGLYYAADIKFREEFQFGSTRQVQLGYKYGSLYQPTLRFAVNHSSGYEERGQFYTDQRSFAGIGLYLDF